jgi:hypothetical protein
MGRGFHQDLILVIVLEAIGILTITTIRGSTRGLYIGHIPGFWTEASKQGSGMTGSCSYFHIIGLEEDTPFIGPESLKC